MKSKITPDLVVAYANCPRKAFLILHDEEVSSTNEYVSMLEDDRIRNRENYLNQLNSINSDVLSYSPNLAAKGHPLLTHANLEHEYLLTYADILKLNRKAGRKKEYAYEPTIIVGSYSISYDQRLLLAYAELVLSKIEHRNSNTGKIIGADGKIHKICVRTAVQEVERILEVLRTWLLDSYLSPPPVILNRHCSYCQYRESCRLKACESDHLSILDGIKLKEIRKLNERGIFTVTQLSYTYRPRRQVQKYKSRASKSHYSLRALSIRNKRVYIVNSQKVDYPSVSIFLDVEGIPDQNFYYLIGMSIVMKNSIQYISYWADSISDEEKLWRQFLNTIRKYEEATIFHYGRYEVQFINRMINKYGIEKVLGEKKLNLVNILSLIYGNIYFPTYSNSLKDIGAYLGCKWSQECSSGLQSLVWRHEWEITKNTRIQNILIKYNKEDCIALQKIAEAVLEICREGKSCIDSVSVSSTDDIKTDSSYKFGKSDYLIDEMNFVNKCSYFNYQRDRIYFRSKRKPSASRKSVRYKQRYRPNQDIYIATPTRCRECGGRSLYRHGLKQKVVNDVRFLKSGVKRWIIRYRTRRVRCRSCKSAFSASEFDDARGKYGRNLYVWIVFNMIALRQTHGKIEEGLRGILNYHIGSTIRQKAKDTLADYYSTTYKQILKTINTGTVLHADETCVSIQGVNSYIWVFTNLRNVVYMFGPTREGEIIKRNFGEFGGVLVSDFYSAYDAVECPQQKCLIHLIRDMNDDLRKNPFDEEYKHLVQSFGRMLQSIVITVNKLGLKKRFLKKHKKEVRQFFRQLSSTKYQSEVFHKFKKRLEKYKSRLFTFLDYDDIPWNNNNAEHAIKAFAAYRKIADGCFTEAGIRGYLVLLSIYETCKYRNIDFLKFLLSDATDIDDYERHIQKKGHFRTTGGTSPR